MRSIRLLMLFFVASASHAGSYIEGKTISQIAMGWGGEGVYITVVEPTAAVEGCIDSRYFLSKDTPLFKENLAALISAFHGNTKIGLFVVGCSSALKTHNISAINIYKP